MELSISAAMAGEERTETAWEAEFGNGATRVSGERREDFGEGEPERGGSLPGKKISGGWEEYFSNFRVRQNPYTSISIPLEANKKEPCYVI